MTKLLRFLLIALLMVSSSFSYAADEGYNEQENQFVRVTNNDDGSRTIFKRIPGQRQLVKRTYDPNGTLISLIVYISDVYGEMRSCKIYDAKKNELFKVAYGYDRFGRLVLENMYDSKNNELVSVFQYPYGADGKRGRPIRIVKRMGEKFSERSRFEKASALESDPFAPKTAKDMDKKKK